MHFYPGKKVPHCQAEITVEISLDISTSGKRSSINDHNGNINRRYLGTRHYTEAGS